MKTLYTLEVTWYNGTVTMGNQITNFTTKELAEKTKSAVEKANEVRKPEMYGKVTVVNSSGEVISTYDNVVPVFPVVCRITETPVFEDESEVPILNKKENVDN